MRTHICNKEKDRFRAIFFYWHKLREPWCSYGCLRAIAFEDSMSGWTKVRRRSNTTNPVVGLLAKGAQRLLSFNWQGTENLQKVFKTSQVKHT